MCGIAGIMHLDRDKPVNPVLLTAMAAIQRHRGPDGFGVGVSEGRGVGFSHARLSIIDLQGQRARQPFTSEDKRLLLAHNGELYDYQRLRARLHTQGARFATKSDSELALHLYPRLGMEGMLRQMRGEFAFALYDRDEDALYLVRDRFGIKPLYWTNTGDAFVFGSEIKVLFAHPDVKRAFAPAGLYHQLMQLTVPGATAFQGVRQVRPGHVVKVRRIDGDWRIEEKPYWDMNFPAGRLATDGLPEEHHIETVREKLLEAVHLRLEADVPVGCYLSGGIDSCSILGLAAALRQRPVKAFTIGFKNAAYDESEIATEMARSTGADQDILRLGAGELYGHFADTHWHTERTIYNTLGVAKYLMSRHVQQAGYKVVVTGEGSDELFAGYPSFRRDMILHGLEGLSARERAEMEAQLNRSNSLFRGAMLAEHEVRAPELAALCGFVPSCLQPWLAAGEKVSALLNPALRDGLRGYSPEAAIAAELDPDMLRDRHPLDKAQYVWIKTMLEGQILTWGGDRVDMAHSLEARPAFLDHHLAEAAAGIPPTMRIKGPTEKYVLREAMKGVLPERLYKREKFAFMAPPAHTDPDKQKALAALADEYLSDAAIADAGLLDPTGVTALRSMLLEGTGSPAERVQADAVINHVLGVQILHRLMVAQDVPALAMRKAKEYGWAN